MQLVSRCRTQSLISPDDVTTLIIAVVKVLQPTLAVSVSKRFVDRNLQ